MITFKFFLLIELNFIAQLPITTIENAFTGFP